MKKLLKITLFCVLILGMAGIAGAESWGHVYDDDDAGYLFELDSFQKTGAATYTVLIKEQYNEQAGQDLSARFNFPSDLAYTLTVKEYNHQTKEHRYLKVAFYDKDNVVIRKNDDPSGIAKIAPDSADMIMFNATYDYYQQNYK